MIYKKGTITITNGSWIVDGTGTKWLKRVDPGDVLYVDGSDKPYYIAAVGSDTKLYLSAAFAEGAKTDVTYAAVADFSKVYSIPTPRSQDVRKASVLKRSINKIDSLLYDLGDRVFQVEYPIATVLDITVVPIMETVELEASTAGVEDATVYPTIDPVVLFGLIQADSNTIRGDSNRVTADGSSI